MLPRTFDHTDQAFIRRFREEANALPPPRLHRVEPKLNRVVSGGIAETPGGRLWAAWLHHAECRYSQGMLAYSDDNGESWSAPCFETDISLISNDSNRSTMTINLWTAPDGKLFCFYDCGLEVFDGEAGIYQSVCENPDVKLRRKEEDLVSLQKMQRAILETCSRYVKKGGALYYSTCSVFACENDGIVRAFLSEHPEYVPERTQNPLPHEETAYGLQFLPDAEVLLAEMSYELIPAVDYAQKLIRDPKDQPILNAAIAYNMDVILTGDKDFLALHLSHPRCLTAAQFLNQEGIA